MRFCSQTQMLRLARCSRTTLSATSHPIVWAERPPLVVHSAKIPECFSRSLLANHPIAPRWQVVLADAFTERFRANSYALYDHLLPALNDADVAAVRALAPSIARLDITGLYWLRERDWCQL